MEDVGEYAGMGVDAYAGAGWLAGAGPGTAPTEEGVGWNAGTEAPVGAGDPAGAGKGFGSSVGGRGMVPAGGMDETGAPQRAQNLLFGAISLPHSLQNMASPVISWRLSSRYSV
jgi:hypothetical protein